MSITDKEENIFSVCGTYPSPILDNSKVLRLVTSISFIKTFPSSGFIIPETLFKKVDLPHPLGPIIVVIVDLYNSKLMFLIMTCSP